MTRTRTTRRSVRKTKTELSPRAVLLAGIGAVSLCRKQAKARLAPVQKQASQFAQLAQAEFEARFAPVLVKLGAKAPAKKRTARTVKRTTRPAAKRTRKRA